MSRSKAPSYRLHKPSNRAVVRLNGHDVYLGKYGSSESRAEYDRVIAEWLANGRMLPQTEAAALSVTEAVNRYLAFAATYYRQPDPDTGILTTTNHYLRVSDALKPLTRLYGHTPADRFGPLALQAVQVEMVRLNWCRKYVNGQIDCVKRAFRWLVSQELVPSSVYEGLRCVPGLRQGRTDARETDPVEPVPEEHIEPVRIRVSVHVRALIDLQLLTGARPGEALDIRPAEIDRSGAVWLYRPRGHKTRFRGHERTIYLGPRAQAVLAPYLDREPGTFCFVPAEAAQLHYLTQGLPAAKAQQLASRYKNPRYPTGSYSDIIRSACRRAGISPTWHPHALRHNAATRILAQFGWEAARIILGHKTLSATRIYGADNLAMALDVVSKVG